MTKLNWLDDVDGLIIEGDVLDALARLEPESVEAIVTDPPYDLLENSRGGSGRSNEPDNPYGRHGSRGKGFMGMTWDATGIAFKPSTWEACHRVLKPGGHLVVFGGTRTHHRMWCAVEDAGFEVREMLLWLYGQGFPKSYNVGQSIEKLATMGAARRPDRELGVGRRHSFLGDHPELKDTGGAVVLTTEEAQRWAGWGTALKPAVEPILLARKPMSEKNTASNVLAHGTGALNIDATRIPVVGETIHTPQSDPAKREGVVGSDLGFSKGTTDKMQEAQRASVEKANALGRWPANVLLECTCDDPQPVPEMVRARCGEPSQERRYDKEGATNIAAKPGPRREGGGVVHTDPECPAALLDAQSGLSQSSGKLNRFDDGAKPFGGGAGHPYTTEPGHQDFGGASRFFYCPKATKKERGEGNTHPTVKPLAVMRWLVRLVTPPDGVVLDPFCGSGTTLLAATDEGFGFIGIEINPEYVEIALRRVKERKE